MDSQFVIDPEKRLICMRLRGEFSKDDMLQSFLDLAQDPLFDHNYNVISDIREAVYTISIAERIALHQFFKENMPLSTGRSAFVVESQLDTAFAFLFSEDLKKKREIRVFSSINSARRWLGYSEELSDENKGFPPE